MYFRGAEQCRCIVNGLVFCLVIVVTCENSILQHPPSSPRTIEKNFNNCLSSINLITAADTRVSWSFQGYHIADPAAGGVSFTLVMHSDCLFNPDGDRVSFTRNESSCEDLTSRFSITQLDPNTYNSEVSISEIGKYYICVEDSSQSIFHQGIDPQNIFNVDLEQVTFQLPLEATIPLIVVCQIFAALFSGLNLGLLSLDLADLKILKETGSFREKYYATKIYPLRRHPNYLLCAIVLAQTLLNAVNTLLLDSIVGGIVATIVATFMITIFGEIIPQAVCSRYGLLIGAVSSPFTWFIMVLTAPISWPFGKILDKILGDNPPMVYTRDHISFMLREHTFDLDKTEQRVVEGVMALRNKPILQYMTKLKDVFMLEYDDKFDDSLFLVISKSGYSRVPVYKKHRSHISGVVHIKDLAMLDTSNPRTIGMVTDAFALPVERCKDDDKLSTLLEHLEGLKSHLLIVEHDNNDGSKDAVGIITIEDVVENLLSLNIRDEYDDAYSKKFSKTNQSLGAISIPLRMPSNYKTGAIQFLSTLEPFTDKHMSMNSLSRLVSQCYVDKENKSLKTFIVNGQRNNHFMLILSGSAMVEAGTEKLKYDAGPYCYFGLPVLLKPEEPHIPDFTISTDQLMQYIWISKEDWQKARQSKTQLQITPGYPLFSTDYDPSSDNTAPKDL